MRLAPIAVVPKHSGMFHTESIIPREPVAQGRMFLNNARDAALKVAVSTGLIDEAMLMRAEITGRAGVDTLNAAIKLRPSEYLRTALMHARAGVSLLDRASHSIRERGVSDEQVAMLVRRDTDASVPLFNAALFILNANRRAYRP